jgi:hypothetical protein
MFGMSWYVDAIVVGIILPWVIVTYKLLAAFRRSVGAGLLQWLIWAAMCVPVTVLLMWGIQQLH